MPKPKKHPAAIARDELFASDEAQPKEVRETLAGFMADVIGRPRPKLIAFRTVVSDSKEKQRS